MIAGTAFLAAAPGHAQIPVAVTGVVTDSVGNPLFGAAVSIAGTPLTAMTDERGEFRIVGVASGMVEIRARRLGFVPVVHETRIPANARLHRVALTMRPLPMMLTPVLVQTGRVEFRGRLAGYYERLHRRASGQFITRHVLDGKQYRSLSQIVSQAAGITRLQSRTGAGVVRMRGRSCRPFVWLDGLPMGAGEVDLDAFPVSTIHGIELYLGSTTAPSQYTASRGRSNCGTILIWSRGPDTDPPSSSPSRRIDLDELVSTDAVYTPDRVDQPAVLDPSRPLEMSYPPALFATGTTGTVVAEFIVDATGRVEPGTLVIVSSSHPLFSAAVRRALGSAVYVPASREGRQVRQVVQQPVRFVAVAGSARGPSPASHTLDLATPNPRRQLARFRTVVSGKEGY